MEKRKKMPMHGKQFAREYVQNGHNALQAVLACGVSKSSAPKVATRLSQNVLVQNEIERLEKRIEDKALCTKEELIRDWVRIKDADPGDVMTWSKSNVELIPKAKLSKENRKLIKSISKTRNGIKIELEDRDSAKKELAKLLGLYPEKGTGTGPGTILLVTNVPD